MSEEEIIIIRRPGSNATVTVSAIASGLNRDQREFIREVAVRLEAGLPIHWLDQWRLNRLIKRVIFG